ncbi:MAG: cysteine--tRNA ligase, partial [Promethearchaeota archaeon]
MKIYNSLTFKEEEFKTIYPRKVLMYVCGPTVYDSPHLGHAKSAVAFDIIRRYLEFKGFEVKIVKNYTDIDDKIINRAREKNMDYLELANQYIEEYERIMRILNVKKETFNPRATETIDYIIKLIEGLISKGYAYESNGSVYFSVKSFPKYNTLFQNIKEEDGQEEEGEWELEEQDLGIEEKFLGEKRDPKDFVLWKKWKEGEPYWESPWGRGRPGWHIECSAMVLKYLGETIDIHGGGQDLKSPHHKNEIAQSEAYTGKKFANYFIHNGFVNVDNEKMSKSLGNFFLVVDVIKEFDPMVIRLFLISSHYRSSVNYSLKTIQQAEKNYRKLKNTIKKIMNLRTVEESSEKLENLTKKIKDTEIKIMGAMDNDFDTPVALAEIYSLFRELNKSLFEDKIPITEHFKDEFFNFLLKVDKIFGIFPNLSKELSMGLDLKIAGSFDKRGELIEQLLDLIIKVLRLLREKKIYDLSETIQQQLRTHWMERELSIEGAGSFDRRGQLIKELSELLDTINQELKKINEKSLLNFIRNRIDELGLVKPLDTDKTG